ALDKILGLTTKLLENLGIWRKCQLRAVMPIHARNGMAALGRTPVLPEATSVGALSAQLSRPRTRSRTAAIRRDRTSRAVGALTLSAMKRTTRWSKTKRRPARRRRSTTD